MCTLLIPRYTENMHGTYVEAHIGYHVYKKYVQKRGSRNFQSFIYNQDEKNSTQLSSDK